MSDSSQPVHILTSVPVTWIVVLKVLYLYIWVCQGSGHHTHFACRQNSMVTHQSIEPVKNIGNLVYGYTVLNRTPKIFKQRIYTVPTVLHCTNESHATPRGARMSFVSKFISECCACKYFALFL